MQELLDVIAEVGLRFGMELHWDKFQLLEVNAHYSIKTPTGEVIQPSEVMSYLGANMYADGAIRSELNKKLGAAWAEFCKSQKVWNHSSLTMGRKLQIYQAVVVSRLLYGLSSAWLNVAESRRLNGFHARCLRKVTGIKPSFISRVSNAAVLKKAGQAELRCQLLRQQLLMYGRLARASNDDVLRQLTFIPDLTRPATGRYVRRVGRPRNEWAVMLEKETRKMHANPSAIINDQLLWKRAVVAYCV